MIPDYVIHSGIFTSLRGSITEATSCPVELSTFISPQVAYFTNYF